MSINRTPRLPPCEETAPVTENWCYSQVNVVKCSYTWIINNFTFCRTEMGKVLRSSVFSAEANTALKWLLQVHPNGDGEENKDYISVYLRLLSGNKSEVKAKYKCSIIDEKKAKTNTMEGQGRRMMQRVNYGWKRFIKAEDLRDEPNGLLPDDVLTIHCEITAFGDIVNVSGQKFRVPECRLLDNLSESLVSGKFADVTLVAREKEMRAHKVILAACSPVFAAMFDHDMIEQQQNRVDITDTSYEVLHELLRFMYTGRAENLEKMAYGLLAAADKYAIEVLKVTCEEALCSVLTVDNAAEHLILADHHNANHLKAQAIEFVNIHTTEVMETNGFKAMVKSHPHLIAEALHVSATRKKICPF